MKKRTVLVIHSDDSGFWLDPKDFDDIMRNDSPTELLAERLKLKGKNKK